MSEAKTVLILSNHFITLYNFRRELIARLVGRGHRVVISMPEDENNSYFSDLGCEIICTAMSRRGMNPLEDLRLVKSYRKIMRDVKPDIILSYTIKPNIYGCMASNALGLKQICNITGTGATFLHRNLLSLAVSCLYRVSVKKAYKVFFQNTGDRDFFIENRMVGKNCAMLPGSGVNLEQYSLTELPDDGVVNFIFIGRVMDVKGIDQYLECAKAVRSRCPDTRFYIAGFIEQEKYRPVIEEYTRSGFIEYLGFQKNIVSWIRACHCTVLPSLGGEGVPNVLLESAATGRACIASDINGSRDVIDEGVNGFFFPAGSAEGLKAAVEKYLSLSYEQKRAMGLAGRKKIEREFDREIVISTYISEVEA